MNNNKLTDLIQHFEPSKLVSFFREKNTTFKPIHEILSQYDDDDFSEGQKLGEIPFSAFENFMVCSFKVNKALSERSGKKAQYEQAKKVLKESQNDAGIFVFYDAQGNFRFSLVFFDYQGRKRQDSPFKRFTYFVSPQLTNKTFLQRIGEGDFSTLDAIKEAFSVEKVTKDFYQEISYWYFWACQKCQFPKEAETEANGRQISVIRLITRLIFVWFMRERNLVPTILFEKSTVKAMLNDLEDHNSSYYLAILQNLFFATLNTKISERQFRTEVRSSNGYNPDFNNQNKYRHQSLFTHPEMMQEYFADIPFLNGGLFDCLDEKESGIYIDGFSDTKKYQPVVPNELFFSDKIPADLNAELGTSGRVYAIKGLFEILSGYNFTIDENKFDDKDVALDPELLGRVFENLLASFNPETSTTARKATGSYYTPREIVDYMVDESLKAYFRTHLADVANLDEKISSLFSLNTDENPFDAMLSKRVVELVENVRIVDPAVGSGAFPMGALNKLVFILSKVDKGNQLWKQAQLAPAEQIPDGQLRTQMLTKIEVYFQEKNPDYGRKIYLIQKCIYGVDIQQIAVEIAKLRFFISLLVEETIEKEKENWGIEPLPNLDFKIMQGNSLISEFEGIRFDLKSCPNLAQGFNFEQVDYRHLIDEYEHKKETYQTVADHKKKKALQNEIDQLLIKIFKQIALAQQADYARGLAAIDRKYASIPDPKAREKIKAIEKQKYSQKMGIDIAAVERQMRQYASKRLKRDFFPWELYFAEVFTLKGGFDVVIGNPPYIQLQNNGGELADLYADQHYETFARTGDIYCLFYELGHRLLCQNGHLCFITSNKWMRAGYGNKLRLFFSEKTNPHLLIDFAGTKVFESVTVDNNILLYKKAENNKACQTITVGDDLHSLEELAPYIRTNAITSSNYSGGDSWVISTSIEDQIRQKIEAKGTPLKDWDINIYYGIKTGYNEAFIIDGQTKECLIREDPRSAEILKPVLRGKDIKRYHAEFADLWMIDTHNGYMKSEHIRVPRVDVNKYPAVKRWLDKHWEKIRDRQDQGDTPYNLRSCAYYDEFEKEKIVYPNMTKYLPFFLDTEKFITNQKCFIMTGNYLFFLTAFLNSQLFKFVFRDKFPELLGGTRELSKIFFEEIRIPIIDTATEEKFKVLVKKIQARVESKLSIKEEDGQVNRLILDIFMLDEEERKVINSYEL